MLKRIGFGILGLLLIVAATIYGFRKQLVKRIMPTVEQVGEIDIRIKNDTAFLSSKLAITNHTFLKIKIDTVIDAIYLSDEKYMQNKRLIGSVLGGYGTDTIDFKLKIPYLSILNHLKNERKLNDSASYSIQVLIQYSTAFHKTEFLINKSANFKIPQAPEIEIENIKYKKIRFKYVEVDAKVRIINHSHVFLIFNKINYSMRISNQMNTQGSYSESVNLRPNTTTFINIPIKINVNNMGKTIVDVVNNRDKYPYTLTLSGVLESSGPLKKTFLIEVTKSGEMELVK